MSSENVGRVRAGSEGMPMGQARLTRLRTGSADRIGRIESPKKSEDDLDALLGDLVTEKVEEENMVVEKLSPASSKSSGKGGFWSAFRTTGSTSHNAGNADVVVDSAAEYRIKVNTNHKIRGKPGPLELDELRLSQCLTGIHMGPIWALEMSPEGMFLATGGEDSLVGLWRVLQHDKEAYEQCEQQFKCDSCSMGVSGRTGVPTGPKLFSSDPWRVFTGHTKRVMTLSWSRSQFLLSGSDDCTIRLWHVERDQCLFVFHHNERITSVTFDPNNDSRFACGSESIIRVWNIPEGKVLHWFEVPQQVTSIAFSRDGNMLIAGLEDGEVRFYAYVEGQGYDFFTQIECRNRRGIQRKGKRVTGISNVMLSSSLASPTSPNASGGGGAGKSTKDLLLVSTNDSRIRVCTLDTYLVLCKYKGPTNNYSPIHARVNDYSHHIICSSEDKQVFLWRPESFENETTSNVTSANAKKLLGVVKKCSTHESFLAHSTVVTNAIFAPPRTIKVARNVDLNEHKPLNPLRHCIIITSGQDGHIHVFENSELT